MAAGGMHGGGAWQREHAWWGTFVAGETVPEADGTNPTGMHYCLNLFL